jgi:hypothetical protein
MASDMPIIRSSSSKVIDPDTLRSAIARAAQRWQDPDYPPREAAISQTLAAPNRFTEEALAYAINQQMRLLTEEGMEAWIGGRRTQEPQKVGVICAGTVPLDGLRDLLAVVLTGHQYMGSLSPASPYLLPAFVEEIKQYASELPVDFVSLEDVLVEADALIASGADEEIEALAEEAEELGIDPSKILLRGSGYAIAVVDGQENADEWEGIAEDALLHEGRSRRNVALIWAPADLPPDGLLESLAAFRSVFPPHPTTPGTLKMQQAFLEATNQPHAYGESLEFLLSKGEADVQGAGHLRWVSYENLEDVAAWLQAHGEAVQLIVARDEIAAPLPPKFDVVKPGEAHRPVLTWDPDGIDTIAFLAEL